MARCPYLAKITKMWYLPNTCKGPYISSSTMRQTWKQVLCCGGVISWVLIHPFFLVTYHLKKEILLCQWGDATWTQEAQVFLLLERKAGFEDFLDFDLPNVFPPREPTIINHVFTLSSQCVHTMFLMNFQHVSKCPIAHHILSHNFLLKIE